MPHQPDVGVYFWLLLVATVVAMVVRRSKLPYAIALVLTGLVLGAPRLIPQAHLEPHTLFTVFLPPLLFEASLNLRVEALRTRWRTIALLALGGTLLSTLAVGGLSAWLLRLPLLVGFTFGALISPTDPISVIAVFRRLRVEKRLSLVVEAESLFNDGVAVVLFNVLSAAALGKGGGIPDGIRQFVVVAVGGAAVGGGIGWLASRLTHLFDDHLLEIMLTTVVAFGAYLAAEAIHVSGVIAVVAAGLLVGNYGMPAGMSPTTRLAVSSFWEYAAFAANSMVFLLLGIEATAVNMWSRLGAVLIAAVVVLTGRAAAVYTLAPLAAVMEARFPWPWRHVLVWGGLRGALSMALAMGLPPAFPQRGTLIGLTFGVVALSLLLQGLTIGRVLRVLGFGARNERVEEFHRLTAERLARQGGLAELQRQGTRGRLSRADAAELQHEYEERLEQAEESIAGLQVSDAGLQRRRSAFTRRMALLGEKAALQEAERSGLVDDEGALPVMERIDRELAELEPPER